MSNFNGQKNVQMQRGQKLQIKLLQYYFNSFGRLRKEKSAKQLLKLFSTPRSRVLREKEVDVLKQAHQSTFQFEGESIKTYSWGNGKKIALLCHGWESNAGSLGAFVEPLTQAGYSVIAYDGPAHGSSEGKQANLLTFKAVASEVIQRYGQPKVAIGHSLGANVVMLLSQSEQIPFKKSILISPVNKIQTVFDGFKEIFKIPESIHATMITLINQQSNFQVNQLHFSEVAKASAIQNALIMHDRDDQITSFWHSESLNEAWDNAKLVPIEGSGHYKILWHPKTLQYALEFIKK